MNKEQEKKKQESEIVSSVENEISITREKSKIGRKRGISEKHTPGKKKKQDNRKSDEEGGKLIAPKKKIKT